MFYEKTTFCAVVGVTDPTHNQGELPVGIIKLDKTYTDEEKNSIRREILKMCHDVCEERGRAADIIFVDEMPYTPMGKIDYKKLAKTYEKHSIDFNF
jgi:long-chain acyl-CoA synthetase